MLIVFYCAVYLLILRLVMASLIHFRVMPEKWLESACNVVICGLYAVCMMA